VVSGFVGELFGWREMYYIAAAMMFVCAIVVLKVLPDIQTNFKGGLPHLEGKAGPHGKKGTEV